jgi:hypothetical protein
LVGHERGKRIKEGSEKGEERETGKGIIRYRNG